MASQKYINTVQGRKKSQFADSFPLAASTYLPVTSGRFLTVDSDGNFALTAASDTSIAGWADTMYNVDHNGKYAYNSYGPFAGSATAGATVVPGTKSVHTDDDAVWVPASTTLSTASLAYIGKTCDLAVSGSTTTTAQKVVIATDTQHHVKIIDMDIPANLVLVRANV